MECRLATMTDSHKPATVFFWPWKLLLKISIHSITFLPTIRPKNKCFHFQNRLTKPLMLAPSYLSSVSSFNVFRIMDTFPKFCLFWPFRYIHLVGQRGFTLQFCWLVLELHLQLAYICLYSSIAFLCKNNFPIWWAQSIEFLKLHNLLSSDLLFIRLIKCLSTTMDVVSKWSITILTEFPCGYHSCYQLHRMFAHEDWT